MPVYLDPVSGRYFDVSPEKVSKFKKQYPKAYVFGSDKTATPPPSAKIRSNSKDNSFLERSASYGALDETTRQIQQQQNAPLTPVQRYAASRYPLLQPRLTGLPSVGLEKPKLTLSSTPQLTVQYDRQKGKFESGYGDLSGNVHPTMLGAQMSNIKITSRNTTSGKLSKAREELADLEEKARQYEENDSKKIIKDLRTFSLRDLAAGAKGPVAEIDATLGKIYGNMSDELKAYNTAIDLKKEEIARLEDAVRSENGSDVGFWRGTFSNLNLRDFDPTSSFRMWSSLSDANSKLEDKAVVNKEPYLAVMQAYASNEKAKSDYKGNWRYRAGEMFAESIPFMVDMATSSSLGMTTSVGTRAGINLATKATTKAFGKEVTEKIAKEGFVSFIKSDGWKKGIGAFAVDKSIKFFGSTVDDIANGAILATTIQSQKTAAHIIKNKLGEITADDDGNLKFEDNKSWGSAIWQGSADQIVENLSEMSGKYFASPFSVKTAKGLAEAFNAKKIGDWLTKVDKSGFVNGWRVVDGVLKKMGIHGIAEEIGEEYYGQLWRTGLNLESAYDENGQNLFLNKDFHKDIWGGIALSMGAMKAVQATAAAPAYASVKHGVNKADKRAAALFTGDVWEATKALIDNTTNENMGEIVYQINIDKNMSPEQKAAATEYAGRLMSLRGFNLASTKKDQDGVEAEGVASYMEGYNSVTEAQMNNARQTLEAAEEELGEIFVEDFIDFVKTSPREALNDLITDEQFDEEELKLVMTYLNARQRYEGMTQRVRDDIDEMIESSNAKIDSFIYHENETIQPAVLKVGNRRVYVIAGVVARNEDGSVNKFDSSESIVIRDAKTGDLDQVSPDAILTLEEPLDPTNEKKVAAEMIKQNAVAEAENRVEGVIPGASVTIETENGNVKTTIASVVDGVVTLKDEAGAEYTMERDAVAEAIANAEKAERQAARERLTEQVESKQQPNEYAVGDVYEITDENGITTVKIVEETEDGFVAEITPPGGEMFTNLYTQQELDEMLGQASESSEVSEASEVSEVSEDTPQTATSEANVERPTYERDGKTRVAYHLMPIEETIGELTSDMDANMDDVNAIVAANIKEAEKDIKSYNRKQPKQRTDFADPAEYKEAKEQWQAEMQEWQENVAALQARLAYWQSVQAELGRMAQPDVQAETEEEFDEFLTPESYIANYLGGANGVKITPESFRAETGYGLEEQRKMVGVIAKKENGGVSVERAAEIIYESGGLEELGFSGDVNDVRNIIIDILSEGNPRSYANRQAQEVHDRERAAELEYEENAKAEIAAALNFDSYDDYLAYEEIALPVALSRYSGFNESEYYSNLADKYYQTENEYEQQGIDSEPEVAGTIGSGEILQGEQPSAAERTEGVDVEQQGGTIQGGLQSGVEDAAASEEVGPFGVIYRQFKGKAKEAVAFLLNKKSGEAVGALHHPEIGDIDLVWGEEGAGHSDGFGLAKLAKYHPEVLDNLQEILNDMHVTKRSDNRVQLESDTHQAAVRLTWDNKNKNWLLTAFEKKNSVSDNTTDTGETSDRGKRNDTATPQNTVSDGKATELVADEQAKDVKNEELAPVKAETPTVSQESEQVSDQESGENAGKGGEKQPRRKPRGFRSEAKKTSEELFAEEKEKAINGVYSGDYAKVLAESNSVEEAISKFNDMANTAVAQAEDWKSRQYKKNNTVVAGQNANSAADEYETTIGAANERRKEANIKRLNAEAETLRGYASTLADRTNFSPSTAENSTKNAQEIQEPRFVEETLDKGESGFSGVVEGNIYKNNLAGGNAVAVVRGKSGGQVLVAYASDMEDAQNGLFMGEELVSDAEMAERLDRGEFAEVRQEATNSSGSEAVATNVATEQEKAKIEDVGEVLAGARKDALKVIASAFENATIQSLIELPFAKAFKKPDLKKAVESGALREEDAAFYEAWFSTMVNTAKPKLSRRVRESHVRIWAEDVYKSLQVLKEFVGADVATRDRIVAEMMANKFPTEAEELAKIEQRKEWNKTKGAQLIDALKSMSQEQSQNKGTVWGDKTTPNRLWVTYEVLKRLGYKAGDKIDIPYGILQANATGTGYNFYNIKGQRLVMNAVATVEEGIERIVYLTKLKRGDTDVKHPVSSFTFVPTKTDYAESGRYRVVYGSVYNPSTKEFDSLSEAEAFAKNRKESFVSPIKEVSRQYAYKVRFVHPLTGEKIFADEKEFDTRSEAEQYLQGQYDAVNEHVNDELAKARGEKRVLSADDVVEVVAAYRGGKIEYVVSVHRKYANNMGMPLPLRSFATRADAVKYASEIKEDVFKAVQQSIEDRKAFTFFATGEDTRIGEDYRQGKDVTAEEFMDAFGFRGVQFGNWTNQRDRQMAVNQAYDALHDLAKLLGVSPKALSLNGELGIAFGSRGSGNANAHYEMDEVVINLTKTRGAGSLAHEWWHALDNYFARKAEVPHGMVTDSRKLAMRDELRIAFNELLEQVDKSKYLQRSKARGDYWGRMHEVTARLLAEWVDQSLKAKGEVNTFLSRGADVEKYKQMNYKLYKLATEVAGETPMPYEEFAELDAALDGMPYPTAEEVSEFGSALRRIFDVMQERETDDGKVALFNIADESLMAERGSETFARATEHTIDALKAAGVEVVEATDAMVEEVLGLAEMHKQKKAPETVSVQDEHLQTVVSSADGAKVLKDLDSAITEYENSDLQITDRVQFLRTADGVVYGWAVGGKVYLTKEGMNPNTPAHEYTHLWAQMVEKADPKLWGRIVDGLRGCATWNDVLNDKAYEGIWNDDNRMASEVLSRLTGAENYRREMARAQEEIANANGALEKAEKISAWEQVKMALRDFLGKVKSLFGFEVKESGERRTEDETDVPAWMEFVDMALGDLYSGVNPGMSGGNAELRADRFGVLEDDDAVTMSQRSGQDDVVTREGVGSYTDDALSDANDLIQMATGNRRYSPKQRREYAIRLRKNMAAYAYELANRFGIDNVEVVMDASQLEGKKQRAKGFYSKSTGKITIVIPNHKDTYDIEQTVLHEAVAHYGLRKLFGPHFDTFLDNVFRNASVEVRQNISHLAANNGWDIRKATEEYLARLAEDTYFEAAERSGWWAKLKGLFIKMLTEAGVRLGFDLNDNELRYILWRSYQNLAQPGRFRSVFEESEDISKQSELGVGNYAESPTDETIAAEDDLLMRDGGMDELVKYANTLSNIYAWSKSHKGATKKVVVVPSESSLRKQLDKAGFADHVIDKAEKSMQEGTIAAYYPYYDTIVVYNPHADILEINGYLWHENAHKAINEIYSKEEIKRLFKAFAREDEDSIIEMYAQEYDKEGQAEECIVALLENAYILAPKIIEGGNIKSTSEPTEEGFDEHLFTDIINPIINFIKNGNKEEARRDAEKRLGERLIQKNSGDAKEGATMEMRNSRDTGRRETDEKRSVGQVGAVNFSAREKAIARDRYERRVKSGMYQSREATQDSMLGLRVAMEEILGDKQYIEEIAGFENAYLGENRLSSVNKAEADAFAHVLFKPMLDEVAKLARNEAEREELTDYMMAKHGLERNAYMRNEAIKNGATDADQTDYAGLTALTGMDDVVDAEAEAQRMVDDYEQAHDTTDLWEKVNAVSKAILQKSYECGMMSKETFDKVSDMYEFYIPLRGFDEKTSAEAYAYLSHKHSAFNAPIRKAEGRRSKADDPFSNLEAMAESAIMQGNRNKLVKQRFLNFVINHPSDLVSVSDIWLQYDEVNDEWKPVFPDNIEITDTPETVAQKMQDFEEHMQALAEQAPDMYKRGKDAVDIPYRVVTNNDLHQHQVVVKRNGRDVLLTVNGNPRLAQALNGQTNPDNDITGAIGGILRGAEWVNRQLSAFYTTRNPDFVVSNFVRDLLYTNSMVWVKEKPGYALRFHKNYLLVNPIRMKRLFARHRNGTLDMNDKTDALFYQFMMNGGETGYVNIRDTERRKNDIQRELKKFNGKIPLRKAWDWLTIRLDELNRAVENCARFAAFVTSRELGRTIDRSIYDAKEISVNFNKKGSGGKFFNEVGQTRLGNAASFTSGLGRTSYVFWNAAIQGTTNFGRQAKRHPVKALVGMAAMFTFGMLAAYLGYEDDDEDDKNSYYNLPEWIRRSNILFRAGEHWISLPLPIEYKAVYGLGELAMSVMSGKEHLTNEELAEAILSQVTQILPVDFMQGSGGWNAFVPTVAKPVVEAYVTGKSWTGTPIYKDNPYNKDEPEWTKAFSSANKYIVGLTEWLNETTGGDPTTKGWLDINPAKIEHVLDGYFSGVYKTIDKLTKTAETIGRVRDYDPQNILLLNRLVKAGDERTERRALNNEYYRLRDEHKILKKRMKYYEDAEENGVFDYAEKLDFIYNSPEYQRYEIFETYQKEIKELDKMMDDAADEEERSMIEDEMYEIKERLVDDANETRE